MPSSRRKPPASSPRHRPPPPAPVAAAPRPQPCAAPSRSLPRLAPKPPPRQPRARRKTWTASHGQPGARRHAHPFPLPGRAHAVALRPGLRRPGQYSRLLARRAGAAAAAGAGSGLFLVPGAPRPDDARPRPSPSALPKTCCRAARRGSGPCPLCSPMPWSRASATVSPALPAWRRCWALPRRRLSPVQRPMHRRGALSTGAMPRRSGPCVSELAMTVLFYAPTRLGGERLHHRLVGRFARRRLMPLFDKKDKSRYATFTRRIAGDGRRHDGGVRGAGGPALSAADPRRRPSTWSRPRTTASPNG